MRQWINSDRTVLVIEHTDDGTLTVAIRPDTDAIWGPPITVEPDVTVEQWASRRP